MLSNIQIQDTILSAAYKNSLAVQKNYNYIQKGGLPRNEAQINYIWLNIDGLQYLLNLGDYTSPTTVTLYDRLNNYIGFDTNINSLDPYAQIPETVIEIINPASYIAPIPSIPWLSFDPVTQDPDGNRSVYYNTNWAGFNPVLSLISPAVTALTVGTDYTLIPSGGIILLNDLSGAGSPGIAYGQFLRADGYVKV